MNNQSLVTLLNLVISNAPNLVGVVLPVLIDVLNKNLAPDKDKERFFVSAGVCLVVAVILKWNSLTYGSSEALLASFTLIFTESQIVYKLYFKDSFLRDKLQTIINKPALDANPSLEEPLG